MKKKQKQLLILVLAAGFTALLGSSCRTAQGFGQDVENVGENIERAAR